MNDTPEARFSKFTWHTDKFLSEEQEFKETVYDISNLISLLASIINEEQISREYVDEEHPPIFCFGDLTTLALGIRRSAEMLARQASQSWDS